MSGLLLALLCAALGLQASSVAAISRGLLTPSAPTCVRTTMLLLFTTAHTALKSCLAPCSFAGGTDVFGRTPRCRACHALLHNLQTSLVPRLEEQLRRDARRKATGAPQARRTDYGAYEGPLWPHSHTWVILATRKCLKRPAYVVAWRSSDPGRAVPGLLRDVHLPRQGAAEL